MGEVWFWLALLLLAGWAVLDGFDLGAGVLHRLVAHTDGERRQVLAAIGPLWDGNEVWLLAFAGTLLLAFPRVVAVAFSGLYLPLVVTLWALMGRGAAMELRSHLPGPLWRPFFDTLLVVSCALVALLSGAALGNVVRGVPLGPEGFFELPLFGSFTLQGEPGALDWYTLLTGLFVLVTVAAHGAGWLAWRTEGQVQARARAWRRLWWGVGLLWGLTTAATFVAAGGVAAAVAGRPWTWAGVGVASLGLGAVWWGARRGHDLQAFLGGGVFIVGLMGALGAGLFPVLLPARGHPELSLTVDNAGPQGPAASWALAFWIPAMLLAVGYLTATLRQLRGPARAARDGEGY
jgi:cytochrome bd ubiquinol oxidase subunit II